MSCLCYLYPFRRWHRHLLFHPYLYNVKMFNFYYTGEIL